ncbi:MAG: Protein-L-isoaspartate O-methyltransferase [Gammaproteobacteria bacterium]|nr:Protein-L-isoaspartate O-methyltransferase [Gammaproteobacteria bacterium]
MDTDTARFNMIEQQIRPWEVLDPRVLTALNDVPREEFVPPVYRNLAFADMHIALGHGEIMMQPKQEARLLQALALKTKDRVLEIGAGSGYVTALLARLAGHVDSVDIYPDFIESAQDKLAAHGYTNVSFQEGDAAKGWESDHRYDAILLTGSVPELPPRYKKLLADGGRLAAIVGNEPVMEAVLVEHLGNDQCRITSLFDTGLPPLVHAETTPSFEF